MPRDIFPSGGSYTDLTFITNLVIKPLSYTSVEINTDTYNWSVEPTSYNIYVQKKILSGSAWINDPSYPEVVLTKTVDPFVIDNLIMGATYDFTVNPYFNSSVGYGVQQLNYTMPTDGLSIQTFSSTPKDFKVAKSYMALSVTEQDYKLKRYAIASREFPAIVVPTTKTVSKTNGDEYNIGYFSYGTSLVLDNTIENPNQMGGLGFFINNLGQTGYYILIESTSSSAAADKKSVRIVKFVGNKVKPLKEIGTRTESTVEGIYGGRIYNIDVKVKIENRVVNIDAYINGYKVSYQDSTTRATGKVALPETSILAPTNKVAVLCGRGEVAFDYVYGNELKDYQYADSTFDLNLYQGQFGNDLINTSFGDLSYIGNYTQDEISSGNKKLTALDEFGTVVREILKVDVKYDTRPSYPIKWSTGINKYASIIGQKVSNFGAQAYMLNNTSTTIPVSNGLEASLYIYGNTLGSSGELEYKTDGLNDYTTAEPVIFQSLWLQNEADVKNLASWIKNNVINKGKLVDMSIFGNPLISVGDIVGIKYSYQGLSGTENFIVTNVKHSYSQGLETQITCRTL
jgi:hypothetical protein